MDVSSTKQPIQATQGQSLKSTDKTNQALIKFLGEPNEENTKALKEVEQGSLLKLIQEAGLPKEKIQEMADAGIPAAKQALASTNQAPTQSTSMWTDTKDTKTLAVA
jgi:hypothetical protein